MLQACLLAVFLVSGAEGDSILIHVSKHSSTLHQASPAYADLLRNIEEVFRGANSTYRLVVTKELISQARRNGAVEAVYSPPKQMKLPNGTSAPISRLLIPLEGRFSGHDQSVVFYGTPEYEEFNDVISPLSADRIRELIARQPKPNGY